MKLDYIIVGQGIAGTLLAYEMLRQNKGFLVVDQFSPSSASNVATGLINPVICRNLNPFWKASQLIGPAFATYQEMEKKFGSRFFFPKPMIRVFKSEQDREKMLKRLQERTNPFVDEITDELPAFIKSEWGGIHIKQTAYLDIRQMIVDMRSHLRQLGILLEEKANYGDFKQEADHINFQGYHARRVIFSEGIAAGDNPFFPDLPFAPTKGELITIKTNEIPQDAIWNVGYNLLPVGQKSFKYGATYNWDDQTTNKTVEVRQHLQDKLNTYISVDYEIIQQEAGIRPTVTDRKPLLGKSRVNPRMAIFNGMGSHGGIMAPALARHLLNHLENGTTLSAEMDYKRDATSHN